MQATDLATLIANAKGGRSYDRIAADAGGVPTSARLQQLATKPLKNFPDPDTIRGLARGLSTSVTEVVAACAASLGLSMHLGADPDALVIGGAASLPPSAREAITAVAREMLKLGVAHDEPQEAGGEHEQRSAPNRQGPDGPAPNIHELRPERRMPDPLTMAARRGQIQQGDRTPGS